MRALLVTAVLAAAAVAAGPAHAFELAAIDGTFDQPTYLAAPPEQRTMQLVLEKGGRIWEVEDSKLVAEPWLDIHEKVDTDSEEGLLSMAFDRDFAQNGRYWIAYSADAPDDTDGSDPVGSDLVVEERDHGDDAYSAEVIRIPHREFANHNGGQLQLGPDGNLWLSTGDGGGANDPLGNAQDRHALLGKILRFTPIAGGGHAVPQDNPFADGAGGAPEVWAYGLRNPWRFSFDEVTGDLLIGDVGQSHVEEVDRAAAPGLGKGDNYGWVPYEGTRPTGFGGTPPVDHHPPLLQHTRGEGWISITGGYVIHHLACEDGLYVYGDFGKGELWLADPVTGETAPSGRVVPHLSSFGVDGVGRVYAISLDGKVYRLVADAACPPPGPAGDPGPAGGGVADQPPGGAAPGDGAPPPTGDSAPGGRTRALLGTAGVARAQRALRRRAVLARLRCTTACRVRVTGRLLAGRAAFGLQPARTALAAGAAKTLRLRIGGRALRAAHRSLRSGRRVRARLILRATDAAGATATKTLTVEIRR